MKKLLATLAIAIACMTAQAQDKDMNWYVTNAPFKMPATVIPQFKDQTFNITDYGAVNDGQTMNTEAIQKTIDACAAAGGGKVLVPSGLWLTAPIQLRSNVNFHIVRGAIIEFTPNRTLFPIIKTSPSSKTYMVQPPIYGTNLENVAITGEGIFDGNGESWRPLKRVKATDDQWKKWLKSGGVLSKDEKIWWPSKAAMEGEQYLKTLKDKENVTAADYEPARDFLRPKLCVITNSKNVLIDGPTFKNSPNFVLNPQNCTNLVIRNVQINNEWWAQNGDGIDISASNNVIVYNCTVNAGDDGICMKSSGGKKAASDALLQNVIVANCIVYHGHGGFVIGSNTDGGMKNIYVTNCSYIGTDIGIRVKSNAGRGGLVRDIFIDNIYMRDIVDEAILFDTYYENVGAGQDKVVTTAKDKIPEFCNFNIKNVVCNGATTAISITGLPEMPVHDINFENMVIAAKNGFVSKDASDINLKKVKLIVKKQPVFKSESSKNINVTE